MIQPQTIVKVADNSGAKIGRVFKVLGSSKKRYARIGELVIFSVQKAEPRKEIKKKAVLLGLVVPKAGRIFGPIPREIAELGMQAIVTLAPEVI